MAGADGETDNLVPISARRLTSAAGPTAPRRPRCRLTSSGCAGLGRERAGLARRPGTRAAFDPPPARDGPRTRLRVCAQSFCIFLLKIPAISIESLDES